MVPKCSYFFSEISIPTNSAIVRTFSHFISKPLWQPLQTGPGSSFFPLESTQCPFASLIILKYFISHAYFSAQRSAMASCFQKWIKMPEPLWPSLPWSLFHLLFSMFSLLFLKHSYHSHFCCMFQILFKAKAKTPSSRKPPWLLGLGLMHLLPGYCHSTLD